MYTSYLSYLTGFYVFDVLISCILFVFPSGSKSVLDMMSALDVQAILHNRVWGKRQQTSLQWCKPFF